MFRASIVGNIGADPELRYTADGRPRLTFNVASNGRTPQGEWQDTTEWCRCIVFGDRAEALAQHLTRGTRIYVDGKLESRPWIDRSNNPRAGLELVVAAVEFVSSRERDEDSGRQQRRQPVANGAEYQTGRDDLDLVDVPF